ncbi:MAG: hypothetical protein LBR24_01030, partial [Methanobrevibacter sp.]|nr:hypothetical protein [Methanobrevibacter sp.]
IFYRPEYNKNPNLRAQKGLFTILRNSLDDNGNLNEEIDMRGLDEILVELFDNKDEKGGYKLNGLKTIYLKENEKVLYKFVISSDLKSKILSELYSEGYSEEFLYPGYKGVSNSIKNKAILQKLLDNTES